MTGSKKIALLGSTGSIGRQSLDVVDAFPTQFQVVGLTAGQNITLLKKQILAYKPKWAMIHEDSHRSALRDWASTLSFSIDILETPTDLAKCLSDPDIDLVMMAIVGTAALHPTAAALSAGKQVGLASKEVLVAAGDLMMGLAKTHGGCLLPVDSEHAALQQCLAAVGGDTTWVSRVVLTASGGPFRTRDACTFSEITPQEALKHPRWTMGAKISIDSATLMNKGLEVIEAHHLFGLAYEQIDVVVHPQSLIHAMTETVDGNLLAHLGPPDMRFPIQYAMTYPQKYPGPWPRLDITGMGELQFEAPDFNKFPLLKLAYTCGKAGGAAPLVMNAANEVLVAQFLAGKIGFLDIISGVENTVSLFAKEKLSSLDQAIALDLEVKRHAQR